MDSYRAGGLTKDNVARAIEKVRPFGVDVETGVSVRIPGEPLAKDINHCRKFVAAVRNVRR